MHGDLLRHGARPEGGPHRALLLAGLLQLLTAGLALARDEELTKLLATLERADSRAALELRLDQDPSATLAALPWTLPEALPGGDWQSTTAERIQAALAESVETAFGRARDKRVFLVAASRDGLPPIVLGILRHLSRTLSPGATTSTDQGAPDVDGFLRDFVAFEDSAEVRALACETLARLTPTRPTAEVLLAALQDPEGPVQSAARRALGALSGKSGVAAWRAWATGLAGPALDVAGPDLITTLTATDRRARFEGLAAVERALLERPDETLGQLQTTLDQVEALEPVVAAAIRDVVLRAVEKSSDPDALLGAAATSHPAVAAGIARGIGARAARLSDPDAIDPGALHRALVMLADRTEPSVRAEALRVLPALAPDLDERWAERLFGALDDPALAVRDAAWTTLRALTKQTLPQSSVTWRRWWSALPAPTPSEGQ